MLNRYISVLVLVVLTGCFGAPKPTHAFTRAVAVTVDDEDTPFVLDASGSVWGYLQPDDFLEPVKLPRLSNIKQIVPFAALTQDGHVFTWDYGSTRTCGFDPNGPFPRDETYSVPREVLGLDNVVFIAGADRHFLALRKDGTVVAFGRKLFVGTPNDPLDPCAALPQIDEIRKPFSASFASNSISIATDGVSDSVLEKDGFIHNFGFPYSNDKITYDSSKFTNVSNLFAGNDKILIYSSGYIVAISRFMKAYYWGTCGFHENILIGKEGNLTGFTKFIPTTDFSLPDAYIFPNGRIVLQYPPDRGTQFGLCMPDTNFSKTQPEFFDQMQVKVVDAALPIGVRAGGKWLLMVGDDGSLWKIRLLPAGGFSGFNNVNLP